MSAHSAPQQPIQPPLLPTIYSLLPPSLLPQTQARISLLALHAEPHAYRDKVYVNAAPVLPGQKRTLRLRKTLTALSRGNRQVKAGNEEIRGSSDEMSAGGEAGEGGKGSEGGEISLAFLSQPLSGREYEEVSMRSVVEVDVAGASLEEDIEDFITTLGCEYVFPVPRAPFRSSTPPPLQSSTPPLLRSFLPRPAPLETWV
jgi:hypothetical protein